MNPYSLKKLPSDISIEIARNHRIVRKKAKLSQTELSKRAGVSLGSIKRFERTGKISLESLLKLAHILGYLLDFEKLFVSQFKTQEIEQLFSNKTRE